MQAITSYYKLVLIFFGIGTYRHTDGQLKWLNGKQKDIWKYYIELR